MKRPVLRLRFRLPEADSSFAAQFDPHTEPYARVRIRERKVEQDAFSLFIQQE